MKKKIFIAGLIGTAMVYLTSCYNNQKDIASLPTVSFVNQIAPILTSAACGCHNNGNGTSVVQFSNLYKQQSASAKELDNVTLQYNSAKSRVEAAKQMRNEVNAMLSYTNLTAPFSGIVTQKLVDAGSMANPGMPILTIEQSGVFQVSASVPENNINEIHQGMEVTINIKAINKTIKGTVTQINQSSQFTGGQYIVKISIPENKKSDLYAGMYANVFIPIKRSATIKTNGDAVVVPVSCIENKDQLTGLYTVGSNNTALLRWVRLGKTYGDKVEVLSGLENNEQFIVSADGKLFNGAVIKIK